MMTLQQLETWLLNAANIIRGPVDPSDYKAYIFPMLFLNGYQMYMKKNIPRH